MSSPGSSNRVLAGFPVIAPSAVTFASEPVTLRDLCPPGFELTDNNVCELRTVYDGFSPQQIDLGRYLIRPMK